MDTLRSPIPQGSMGGPTGTGRSPRLRPGVHALLEGNGETARVGDRFGEEVDRAEERAELGGAEERLAARNAERSEARRAGFGAEREGARGDASDGRGERIAPVAEDAPRQTSSASAPANLAAADAPRGAAQVAGNAGEAPASRATTVQAPAEAPVSPPASTRNTPAAPGRLPVGTSAATASSATAPPTTGSASSGNPAAAVPGGPLGAREALAHKPTTAAQTSARPQAEEAREAAEILRQIQSAVRSGTRQITVQLEPLTLGRVLIRVGLRGDRVDAVVEADEGRTVQALERHAPELRALLSDVTGGREVSLTLLGGDDPHGESGASAQDGGRPKPGAHPQPEAARETTPLATRASGSATDGSVDTYA